ncbi:Uncharacterized protein Rs2_25714 [Raphanus sativus]|nr:Uncharacterized protein Rs2_25714 [Raphanus sativus]
MYESSRYGSLLLKEDVKNTNWLHSIKDRFSNSFPLSPLAQTSSSRITVVKSDFSTLYPFPLSAFVPLSHSSSTISFQCLSGFSSEPTSKLQVNEKDFDVSE